jgi:single-strand DNA-binding protein
VTVTCWRSLAANVAACLHKGDPVVVKGRMRVRQFDDKEGNQRTVVEVEATTLGHDLTRGVAHFLRTKRSPGDAPVAIGGEQSAAGWPNGPREEPEQDPGTDVDGEFAAADMFDDAGVDASSLQFVAGRTGGEDVGGEDLAEGITDAPGADAGGAAADTERPEQAEQAA